MFSRTLMAVLASFMITLGMGTLIGNAQASDFVIVPLDNDFPDEIEIAADEGKTIVIMFHRLGCPYCDKMRKRVYPHPKVSALYNEKFYLAEVNMNGYLDVITPSGEKMTEKSWSDQMHVRATPAYAFYAPDGKLALRLTGYQDPDMFTAAGRYVSTAAYADGTSFIKFVRAGR